MVESACTFNMKCLRTSCSYSSSSGGSNSYKPSLQGVMLMVISVLQGVMLMVISVLQGVMLMVISVLHEVMLMVISVLHGVMLMVC